MKTLLGTWLLPLLLLLAQQGAYWHQLEHTRAPVGSSSQTRPDADKLCETCLAFSHLADLGVAVAVDPGLLAFGFERPAAPPVPSLPASAPLPRSRGPPRFL